MLLPVQALTYIGGRRRRFALVAATEAAINTTSESSYSFPSSKTSSCNDISRWLVDQREPKRLIAMFIDAVPAAAAKILLRINISVKLSRKCFLSTRTLRQGCDSHKFWLEFRTIKVQSSCATCVETHPWNSVKTWLRLPHWWKHVSGTCRDACLPSIRTKGSHIC